MTDVFDPDKRSWIMSRVRGRDTKPEMLVRRLVHSMGFRYRLHVRKLPGKPDIVLPRHKKVIFVHGCFWHGHRDCRRSNRPSSNTEFWNEKIDRNISRDRQAYMELENLGWKVLTVWECQTKELNSLTESISRFLRG